MLSINVSEEHRDRLSKVAARDMIRAHVAFAMPLEGNIPCHKIKEFAKERVEPIYKMMAETEQSFESAWTNVSKFFSIDHPFIERGGAGRSDDLKRGHWRWNDGGYEAATNWLPAIDPLIELAAEIALNSEAETEDNQTADPIEELAALLEQDAVDEIIAHSTEEANDNEAEAPDIKVEDIRRKADESDTANYYRFVYTLEDFIAASKELFFVAETADDRKNIHDRLRAAIRGTCELM